MITGEGMHSRAVDITQLRLMKLICFYYKTIPTETQISKMFNITKIRAKTILSNIKAIYRNQLKNVLRKSIVTFLKSGKKMKGDKFEFIVYSVAVLNDINDYIVINNPGLDMFNNKPGSAAKATISKDAYNYLCSEFDIKTGS